MRALPSPSPTMPERRLLPLLAVPLLVLGLSLAFLWAKGPAWLGLNLDPEYPYLLNALNVAQGLPSSHTDHPGALVHLVGAGVVRVTHLVAGQGPLVRDLLARPELYLRALVLVLLGLYAAALVFLGKAVRTATGSLPAALLAQATPLLTATALPHLCAAKPEPVTLALGAAFAALAVSPRSRSPLLGAAMGLVAGAALATKLTAAPLVLVPLVVLGGWRAWAAFLGTAAASALLLTAPAWPDIRNLFRFATRLATHSGHYGNGPESAPEAAALLHTGLRLLRGELVFTGGLVLGAVALVFGARRLPDDPRPGLRRPLLGLLLAQLASLAMVAKHPADQALAPGDNYLLPALGLTGTVLALAAALLLARLPRTIPTRLGALAAGGLVLAGVATLLVPQFQHLRRQRDDQLAVVQYREQHFPQAQVVAYYRCSHPAYALQFGDAWAGNRYLAQIQSIHPRVRHFHIWANRLVNGDLDASPAVMQGPPRDGNGEAFGKRATRVFGNDREALYELH